jgi:hypothetical protein
LNYWKKLKKNNLMKLHFTHYHAPKSLFICVDVSHLPFDSFVWVASLSLHCEALSHVSCASLLLGPENGVQWSFFLCFLVSFPTQGFILDY